MSYKSPSIGDLLIATLGSARSTRKFYSIIREREFKRYKKESVQVTLSRLHKKGYVDYSSKNWSLTKAGHHHAKNVRLLSYLPSPYKKDSSDTTIISFDIPEPDRKIRNWLRNQIKIFGYKMLQQSLWIGPGPLPALFLKRLEELKIRKNIKIFSKTKKNA
jgi:CRISPR-associated endonuclease Cas2